MNKTIKKIILAVSAAALVLAAFPVTSAFAAEPVNEISNELLEKLWARQLQAYEKLGRAFEDVDAHIAKYQERIDVAAENGRDVSELQAALDAYEAALKSAQPIYADMEDIVSAHSGFDSDGKVTDAALAKATVSGLRAEMQELKTALGDTLKNLLQTLKKLREANRTSRINPSQDS